MSAVILIIHLISHPVLTEAECGKISDGLVDIMAKETGYNSKDFLEIKVWSARCRKLAKDKQ